MNEAYVLPTVYNNKTLKQFLYDVIKETVEFGRTVENIESFLYKTITKKRQILCLWSFSYGTYKLQPTFAGIIILVYLYYSV